MNEKQNWLVELIAYLLNFLKIGHEPTDKFMAMFAKIVIILIIALTLIATLLSTMDDSLPYILHSVFGFLGGFLDHAGTAIDSGSGAIQHIPPANPVG